MKPITRTTLRTAGVAFALALAAPAAASAATAGFEGDTLVFRAGAGEANLVVAYSDAPGKLKLTESAAPTDGRCTDHPDYDYVECDMPSALRVELGDRDDNFGLGSDFPAGMPLEVYGGDGKDDISGYGVANGQLIDGGAGDDKLDGHEGDDVVRGGPGNDEVIGSAGNDVVEGGDGNDTLKPDRYEDPGNDVVDGGPGFDQVEDWDKPGEDFNPPVSISFDGAANDGRPGEADRVAFEHTCAAACTITVKLIGDRKTARKLGGKTIATGKGSRATGGPLEVTARLTGRAKRRLGRLRKGGATLKVTVVDGGQTQRFAQRVKLKR